MELKWLAKRRDQCYKDCALPGWTGRIACIALGLIPSPWTVAGGIGLGISNELLWDRCKDKCNERYDEGVKQAVKDYGTQ